MMKNVFATFWGLAIFALFCVLSYPSAAMIQTIKNSSADSDFPHFTYNFQDLNSDLLPVDLQSEEIETDDDTESDDNLSARLIQKVIYSHKNTTYPLYLHFKNNRFRHLYLLFEVFRL
jgi:hypothetical protein